MPDLATPPIPKRTGPKPEASRHRSVTETLWPLGDGPFGAETLWRRLGPADEVQIELLLRVPPGKRLKTLLNMQRFWLCNWRSRMRRDHPELSDLEQCRLMFGGFRSHG